MSDLAELYKEVRTLADGAPLSVSLEKAADLALRLDEQDFHQWARQELNGYMSRDATRPDTQIPDYRKVAVRHFREVRHNDLKSQAAVGWELTTLEQWLNETGDILQPVPPNGWHRQRFGVEVIAFSRQGLEQILNVARARLNRWLETLAEDPRVQSPSDKLKAALTTRTAYYVETVILGLLLAFIVYLIGWN